MENRKTEKTLQTEQTRLPGPDTPELSERVGIVEAILFVTGNAVEKREICRAMEITEGELEETLDALESGYDFERRACASCALGPMFSWQPGRTMRPMWKNCCSPFKSRRFPRR